MPDFPASPEDSASTTSIAAENLLPPVEPPRGSFIMQLFLIPLLIVTIIVVIWLLFSWLAHMGTDPETLMRDIERLNSASWQKALTLANQLRDPRSAELRRDEELAGQLSRLLQSQVKARQNDQARRSLQVYLCRALGEFEITTGLPALVAAASTPTPDEDLAVPRAALQALGLLADRVGSTEVAESEGVVPAAVEASRHYAEVGQDDRPSRLLRVTATYVLGLLGGTAAHDRLGQLLVDPSHDVRYNAAIGLARLGDPQALNHLVEMLDPPEDEVLDPQAELTSEELDRQRQWKRDLVVSGALRGIAKLIVAHPELKSEELSAVIEELADDSSLSPPVQMETADVLRLLRQPAPLSEATE